jgi:hypothetical protein
MAISKMANISNVEVLLKTLESFCLPCLYHCYKRKTKWKGGEDGKRREDWRMGCGEVKERKFHG